MNDDMKLLMDFLLLEAIKHIACKDSSDTDKIILIHLLLEKYEVALKGELKNVSEDNHS